MEKVLITGCSSGFGYQTALLLGENNFQVTATTRHHDFKFQHPNISHEYLDMLEVPNQIEDDYDIVIFNAGILDAGLAEHIEDTSIEEIMNVNVMGIMKLCKRIIPKMKQKRKGKLIFISSMAARRPLPNLSVYNASKAAIEAYAKTLYLELSPFDIEVYLIEPGFYKTSLWDDVKESCDEYEIKLKNFGLKSQKNRDMKEVSFQILKICKGKYKRLHSTFSHLDPIILAFRPLIYTKIGKIAFKTALFNFQNMKTQKK